MVARFERFFNKLWQVEQENIILISSGQLLGLLKNVLKSHYISVIHLEKGGEWEKKTGWVYHN